MIFGIFFTSLNDLCYWHDRFIVLFLFGGLQKTMFCLFNKQIKPSKTNAKFTENQYQFAIETSILSSMGNQEGVWHSTIRC